MKIQGVHKLSLQFQKFSKTLFLEIFLLGLFYSYGKYLKFFKCIGAHLPVLALVARRIFSGCSISCDVFANISAVTPVVASFIRCCKSIMSQTLVP